MNWLDILTRGNDEIFQYPDKDLIGAARLLSPQDRPTVPVRLYENATDVEPRFGLSGKTVRAFVPRPALDTIYVSRGEIGKKGMFSNPRRLASALGHEERHVRGADEFAAKKHEQELLKGLGVSENDEYRRHVDSYVINEEDRRRRLFKKR